MEQRLSGHAETSNRAEDQPEAVKRRIRTYQNQTIPVIKDLEKRGVVNKIDASGSMDDVFKRLCTAYENLGL